MRKVKLSQGKYALVDDEDYSVVSEHTWCAAKGSKNWYALTHVRKSDGSWTTVRMHALLTGHRETDHKNGNGLDNRRSNLRPCTHAGNCRNARIQRGRSSRYRGVSWHKSTGKWAARIRVDGSLIHLGVFEKEREAARAYDNAAVSHFGGFARANFHEQFEPHT